VLGEGRRGEMDITERPPRKGFSAEGVYNLGETVELTDAENARSARRCAWVDTIPKESGVNP